MEESICCGLCALKLKLARALTLNTQHTTLARALTLTLKLALQLTLARALTLSTQHSHALALTLKLAPTLASRPP